MRNIKVEPSLLTEGAEILEQSQDVCVLKLAETGAGIVLPEIAGREEHFLTFRAEVLEEHSISMQLLVYVHGEAEPAFTVRFGLLPKVNTTVCIDLNWMDAEKLFPEALPGMLKIVCHGRRVRREEIDRAVLSSMASYHAVTLKVQDIRLEDVYPENVELSDTKLVDCFGQSKWKNWKGKTESVEQLREKLRQQAAGTETGYPFADWSEYGGWNKKKLQEGTGYFSRCKKEGRWWLVDPQGYAFFSMGPDCVGLGGDCRIDGVEKWLDWLPEREDKDFGGMYDESEKQGGRRKEKRFSYYKANLCRALGENWYDAWKEMLVGQLKKHGMNTLGNWSDEALLGNTGIPYVTSLPEFPSTRRHIFRDFPDVFSEEYISEAKRCAKALEKRKQDPLMIGYFLRNEPAWAFVDHLVLADEVLYHPGRTACRERLVAFLEKRYQTIESLNRAWNSRLEGFESLYLQQKNVSKWSTASEKDMRDFSRQMLRAYVEIPVRECRKVDPNHMILGMRWAWISDPDLVTGWENFDVFSINCYAVDPWSNIQGIVDLGVDLPVMIGEFHFGALDAGLPATGLEGVENQEQRGIAYQYYCESVAAHPNGVGCHYFQCYDQFTLGRFDGENYNIGLFDICSCIYPEMMERIRACSGRIYSVADGKEARSMQKPKSIPMIAY